MKAAELGLDADFAVSDALSLPWPDQSFDVVLCRHVLWAVDSPEEALEEWLRVLRPAGHLILIEGRWSTGAGLPAATVTEHLAAVGCDASLTHLRDARFWGHAITDERYVVVGQPQG